MSDTPRVDAISDMRAPIADINFYMKILAVELERKLTAAHKRIAELEEIIAPGGKS